MGKYAHGRNNMSEHEQQQNRKLPQNKRKQKETQARFVVEREIVGSGRFKNFWLCSNKLWMQGVYSFMNSNSDTESVSVT